MTVKELIEELQKCAPECEVCTFNLVRGNVMRVKAVDGIGYTRTVYLDLENV